MKNLATLGMLLLVVAGSAQYVVVQQTVTTTTTTSYPGHVQTHFFQPNNLPFTTVTYNTIPPGYYTDAWGNYIPVQEQNHPSMCQPVTQAQLHPVVCPSLTSASDFGFMLQEISRQHFDSSRLQVAKQVISTNRLTSAQITDIMRLFSFESSRLDIAKFAYNYVVDPQRYFMVNNAFSFSSSVDDLNRYIGQMW
jgi:hypothetical protein